jgi:hypothetical protein
MTDKSKPDKSSTGRAAVIMLVIVGIVVIAFIGMNLYDVTKAVQ